MGGAVRKNMHSLLEEGSASSGSLFPVMNRDLAGTIQHV